MKNSCVSSFLTVSHPQFTENGCPFFPIPHPPLSFFKWHLFNFFNGVFAFVCVHVCVERKPYIFSSAHLYQSLTHHSANGVLSKVTGDIQDFKSSQLYLVLFPSFSETLVTVNSFLTLSLPW